MRQAANPETGGRQRCVAGKDGLAATAVTRSVMRCRDGYGAVVRLEKARCQRAEDWRRGLRRAADGRAAGRQRAGVDSLCNATRTGPHICLGADSGGRRFFAERASAKGDGAGDGARARGGN